MATKARPLAQQAHHTQSGADLQQASPRSVALAVAQAGLDKKAEDVELIDVTGKVNYADYVVVMTGRSDRQVAAIARGIEDSLGRQGQGCNGREGMSNGEWVLLDFSDVIVHIFHEDVRAYYDLESLWMDAKRERVTDDGLFSC